MIKNIISDDCKKYTDRSANKVYSKLLCQFGNFYGISGKNGSRGTTGIIGNIGIKGDTGCYGTKGSPGDKGLFGDNGHQGDSGDIGFGSKGNIGDTSNGDNGDLGDIGNDVSGTKGSDGVSGLKGDDGFVFFGSSGVIINGVNGDNGDSGYEGDIGIFGINGDIGNSSDAGNMGVSGNIGNKGDQEKGVQGNQGDKGNQGNQGDTGIIGDPIAPLDTYMCAKYRDADFDISSPYYDVNYRGIVFHNITLKGSVFTFEIEGIYLVTYDLKFITDTDISVDVSLGLEKTPLPGGSISSSVTDTLSFLSLNRVFLTSAATGNFIVVTVTVSSDVTLLGGLNGPQISIIQIA